MYYGGAVAAPIFKDIADKVFSNHLDIHSQPSDTDSVINVIPLVKAGNQKDAHKILAALNVPVVTTSPDAMMINSSAGMDAVLLSERKYQAGLVPNVSGMGAADAIYYLENAGLVVKVKGRGNVVKQSLTAGTKITRGQIITIELGN
jgi:cell division protein FtsI (penicillin-binding protein 3)